MKEIITGAIILERATELGKMIAVHRLMLMD